MKWTKECNTILSYWYRHDWDQFIAERDNPLASSVPLHWVVPPKTPTTAWAEFQMD